MDAISKGIVFSIDSLTKADKKAFGTWLKEASPYGLLPIEEAAMEAFSLRSHAMSDAVYSICWRLKHFNGDPFYIKIELLKLIWK